MQDNDQLFDKLLAAYFTHEITEEDKEKLFSMIMESDNYKQQYEKAAGLNTFIHLPFFESHKREDYLLLKEKGHIQSHRQSGKTHIKRFTLLGRIAAAILLILSGSLGTIYVYEKRDHTEETFRWVQASTPTGGQTKLVLPDGSVAWINAKSELKYSLQFGSTDRKLYLNGEAYFEVSKNEALPFSVYTGEMEVIATGTMFDVKSYTDDNQCEVQLLEGGVDVLIADQRYSLIPDEKVIYDKSLDLVTIEPVDAYMSIQWTKGKLSFYQASIPDIYKMLERHFNVRIQIDSEELKSEYFLGSINLDMSLSEILSYLDVDKKYKIELRNDIIVIRKK